MIFLYSSRSIGGNFTLTHPFPAAFSIFSSAFPPSKSFPSRPPPPPETSSLCERPADFRLTFSNHRIFPPPPPPLSTAVPRGNRAKIQGGGFFSFFSFFSNDVATNVARRLFEYCSLSSAFYLFRSFPTGQGGDELFLGDSSLLIPLVFFFFFCCSRRNDEDQSS